MSAPTKTSARLKGLPPEFSAAPDEHRSGGRSMLGLRTVVPNNNSANTNMYETAKHGGVPLPANLVGIKTEIRGRNSEKVSSTVPKRTSLHASTFYQATTPRQRSAKLHAQQVGLDIPTKMEILHARGHGQVGAIGDKQAHNLGSGSFGANSQMIPYDDAMSGRTNVTITSHHHFYPGTQVIESTTQSFSHKNFGAGQKPFFSQNIAGDRTPVTREEYLEHQARSKELSIYAEQLERNPSHLSFEEKEFSDIKSNSQANKNVSTSSASLPMLPATPQKRAINSSKGTMSAQGILPATPVSSLSRMSNSQIKNISPENKEKLIKKEKSWRR